MKYSKIHPVFTLLFTGLLLFITDMLPAQIRPWMPPIDGSLLLAAKGTGRTTGHIAELTIQNLTDQRILINPGAVFIPSTGKDQPYIVPEIPQVVVPPKSTITLPIEGYCVDVRRPPVGDGAPMPPVTSWTPVVPRPPGWTPSPENGWSGQGPGNVLIPGTDTPLDYTIDPDTYPGEAGPVLLDALTHIIRAYDELKADGQITTPFSNNPPREREAVIQQTFWIFAASLTGEPYARDEFRESTFRQFTEVTGIPEEEISPEQEEKIDQGVDHFWQSFEATGVKAKILSPGGLPHGDKLRERFGGHDIEGVRPHIDNKAEEAAKEMGAEGATQGNEVVFGSAPDPSTTAHEPAHVVESPPHATGSQPPCACGNARVTVPLRIRTKAGDSVLGDSIGWHVGGLSFTPPEVECPCPEHCLKVCEASIAYTPVYRWPAPPKTGHQRRSGGTSGTQQLSEIPGSGYIEIETIISNVCDGDPCPETLRRRLYLTEANDCCTRIRQQHNGRLRFSLGRDGFVDIEGNQLVMQLNNPARVETVQTDFNYEAAFCNLTQDQVYAQLLADMGQSTGQAGVRESSNVRDVSMGHNSGGRGTRPHYVLSISQSANGQEFKFVLSMDEETCNVDLSLFHRGQIYEMAGRPDVGLRELQDLIRGNRPGSEAYWDHAINHLFQLLKHEYHGTSPAGGATISSVKTTLISQLQQAVDNALARNPPPHVRAKLNALNQALRSGDAGQIATALVPLTGTHGLR